MNGSLGARPEPGLMQVLEGAAQSVDPSDAAPADARDFSHSRRRRSSATDDTLPTRDFESLRDEREPAHADGVRVHSHHRTGDQVRVAKRDDARDESTELRPAQSLNPDADDRRSGRIGQRQKGMKVGVERHDRLPLPPRALQDLLVGRLRHPDQARVDGLDTELA